MNASAESFINKCHSCQLVSKDPNPLPLSMTNIPKSSWLTIGCDLTGPLFTYW